jgi:hypothetical protein
MSSAWSGLEQPSLPVAKAFFLASVEPFLLHFRCHINRRTGTSCPSGGFSNYRHHIRTSDIKHCFRSSGSPDYISISGYINRTGEGTIKVLCDTVLPKASFCRSTLCLERRLYPSMLYARHQELRR